ncbi:MAG: RluA family pseudouridine synthase, partial [Firmicutes bacterium]|nr:RluA family pseudouridine synthase [Bacillota bacterium]
GLRLDQLVALRTGLSRRAAREALKLGGVQVDQRRVRVAGRIPALGAEIRVAVDDALGALPDLELPVVFEDPSLLVLNKPAGLPTQGTQASDRHDLLALLNRQRPGQSFILCHRLDQGTSGVLVLSKSKASDLGRQFQERTLRKVYLARVSREVPACVVEAPIGRLAQAKPARFGCEGELMDPKPSRTTFRPATEEEREGLVPGHWVICEPHTGRTHQIRVHLASLGAPVVGDGLYGGAPDSQLWLHAWKLALRHPITQQEVAFVAEPTRFLEPR